MEKQIKLKRPKIKAIILDIGGVLALGKYDVHPKNHHRLSGIHNYIAKKLKISIDQYFDAIDTTYAMAIEGHISESETIRIFSRNFKISEKKLIKIYVKAYKRHFKQNKELYKFAFKLKDKGYKIAILSDQWYLSKKALVISKYMKKFDEVVISCDVGVRKPAIKIYKLILKKLRVKPAQCLFIDNQSWNLKPAKKLGIKTILFKTNKQLFKQIKRFGIE